MHRKGNTARIHRVARQQIISLHRFLTVNRRRISDIHLSRLHRGQRRILLHKQHDHFLYPGRLPVIIRICLKNHLLPAVPLRHNIPAGTDRILTVRHRIITVPRNNPEHRKRVQKRIVRFLQMKNNGRLIHRLHALNHPQIRLGILRLHRCLKCKLHVFRRQCLPVREPDIIPDGKSPRQSIPADAVIRGEILLKLHIRRCPDQRGLNQRLVAVLPASPADAWIKTGRRFRGRVHHDNHLRRFPGLLCRVLHRSCSALRIAPCRRFAACENTCRCHCRAQRGGPPAHSFHTVPPCQPDCRFHRLPAGSMEKG